MGSFRGNFKRVWNFFLSSVRFVLFILCLIFVIFQLVWLVLLIGTKYKVGSGLPETNLDVFLRSIVLISAGILGCWASFHKKRRAINWFTFLTIICAIGLVFILFIPSFSGARRKTRSDYIENLKQNAQLYDWKRDGNADERSQHATQIWDSVQSLFCCGLQNATDWNQYRPKGIDNKYFPPSCCAQVTFNEDSGLCSLVGEYLGEDYVKKGCLERVNSLETISMVINLLFVIGLTILSLLSFILSCVYMVEKAFREQ